MLDRAGQELSDEPIDSFRRMQEFGGSLSLDQRRQYDTDGYLVLERLLSDDDLIAPRQAMSQKVDQIADGLVVQCIDQGGFGVKTLRQPRILVELDRVGQRRHVTQIGRLIVVQGARYFAGNILV